MKKLYFLFCPVLILFFISCGEKKSEEKKSAISETLAKELEGTQTNLETLEGKLKAWQENFSTEKELWIQNRPLDSVKVAIEKTSPALRAGWEDLYEQVAMRSAEVDEWGSAINEEITMLQKKMEEFITWKTRVENGEIPEKEARAKLEEWNQLFTDGITSVDSWTDKWSKVQQTDKAVMDSFRSLF